MELAGEISNFQSPMMDKVLYCDGAGILPGATSRKVKFDQFVRDY